MNLKFIASKTRNQPLVNLHQIGLNCNTTILVNPYLTRLSRRYLIPLQLMLLTAGLFFDSSISYSAAAQKGQERSIEGDVSIYEIAPSERGGKAYKLVYLVRVPIELCWQFKTDFENDFLVKHKYIMEHNFISQKGNTAITENKYVNAPDVFFRWQTTAHREIYRLDFVLLNPEKCRQKFHYGHIQLESVEQGTLITQVAYFDFWGASIWAYYPWGGGMREFLSYTAHWEQETILNYTYRYHDENSR